MPSLILDRQHIGRASKPGDRGAIFRGFVEVDLAEVYVRHAETRALDLGLDVIVLDRGEYNERHTAAAQLALVTVDRVAYVACHLNAGKVEGWRGAVFFDARSKGGRDFAEQVVSRIPDSRFFASYAGHWTRNALATIEGIYVGPANLSGICFEPLYLEQLAAMTEAECDEALRAVGVALAEAAAAWLDPGRIVQA